VLALLSIRSNADSILSAVDTLTPSLEQQRLLHHAHALVAWVGELTDAEGQNEVTKHVRS